MKAVRHCRCFACNLYKAALYAVSLPFLLMILAVAGCTTAEVYHFSHVATESDRASLQWSEPDPRLTTDLSNTRLPYFVVDFHQFWPGYSASAYLYVVLIDDDVIELKSMTVRSPETGETQTVSLKLEESPERLENGLRVYRHLAIDAQSSERFSSADRLEVTVRWLDQNNVDNAKTFILTRTSQRVVAWPT